MLHIKKIKPLFTAIITTGDKFEKDMTQGGIIIANQGELKLWQKVIAVGSSVRDINVGDTVMINPAAYMVRKYNKDSIQNDLDNNPVIKYNFNWVTIDDENGNPQECLLLNDRDILYTFEGDEKEEVIEVPNTKKKIIL
jgi:co-chaperonin GroES (HSP10)